jgi:crossover junction endodeoxyribonuclease RuvC
MNVLGVDPGTSTVGFGLIATDGPNRLGRLVECGVIRADRRDALPARLRAIHEGLNELLARHRPDVLAVEDIFIAANPRTAAVLGQARGVILLAGALADIPVVEYTPATIKKVVVGRGAALKPQVAYMVAKLLRLSHPPRPADAADGVAVALTHILAAGRAARPRLPSVR